MRFAEDISTRLDPDVRQGIVAPRHGDDFHRPAGFHGSTEDFEAHVLDDVGHRHQLHAVARIRSVGSIPLHGVVPGHAWEGTGKFDPFHRLPDRTDQIFIELEDLFLTHEAHFDIQLGEFRLAIGAQVFIPEAASNLVVALNASHHQKLFKQLRRLG